MDWLSLKQEASRMLFEKDALHIYAALFVQIAAARFLTDRLAMSFPGWPCSR